MFIDLVFYFKNNTKEKTFLSIIWEGINFDYKVINVAHPHNVSMMHGGDFDVSNGGPRLFLLQSNFIEKELVRTKCIELYLLSICLYHSF
jgi:hypothetical protein